MSAPANATHWVSGEIHERYACTATLASGRIMTMSGELAATVNRRPHLRKGDKVKVRGLGVGPGAWRRFEVVSIECTRDDEGRPSSSGAAIIYLREVSR
jgi:hypothetical protein